MLQSGCKPEQIAIDRITTHIQHLQVQTFSQRSRKGRQLVPGSSQLHEADHLKY
jgi:hypothetical protein